MKANFLTRSLAAKVLFLAVAFSFLPTSSEAFFFQHHHHWKWHHWKHMKKPPATSRTLVGGNGTNIAAAYVAGSIVCATASVMIQSAMQTNPLSIGQAHGSAAGCFLPFLGQWLLVGHYQRMCALSRTNPALREYRIYCPA